MNETIAGDMNATRGGEVPGGAVGPVYCGEWFDDFSSTYRQAHGYLSLIVCLFGSVANLLNIVVLTRREMISPTNTILTGMAVADLLVMLEYIPFAFHLYLFDQPKKSIYTYGWAVFVLLHSSFTQVFHTISIWLTVILAVWRLIAVAYPQRNRVWCGMRRTVLAVASGYIACPIICIPLYFTLYISPNVELDPDPWVDPTDPSKEPQNITLYYVKMTETGKAMTLVNLWIYSVVIKLIPCVALTILSLILIAALVETKRRREALTSGSRKTPSSSEREKQTDRTTRMLLAVLALFLITEFPQGILGLLTVLLGERFFLTCYQKLGDVMDIMALINSAINFMIYCAMSRQFRTTFSLLFRPRWLPLPQAENGHSNHTTTVVTQV